MEKWRVIGDNQVYTYKDKFYQWDGRHGEIEVFNKQGYHIMVIHAVTGERIKDAVRGRSINVR